MPRSRKGPEIPPDRLSQGAQLAAANARALLRFAAKGVRCRHYGPGIALCVLAAEEGAKALALRLEAVSPQPTGLSLADLLSKHKTKHDIAGIASLMTYFIMLARQIKDEVQSDVSDGTVNQERPGSRWVSRIVAELQRMTNDPQAEETRFISWYQHANNLKNDGLYLNWSDSDWHDPGSATAEAFAEYRNYAEWWLNVVDGMLSISNEEWTAAFARFVEFDGSNKLAGGTSSI